MTPTEKRGPGRPRVSATGERRIKAPINMAPAVIAEAQRQAKEAGVSLASWMEALVWAGKRD